MKKKWIIIVAVFLVLAVAGSVYFVGGGSKNEEATAEELFPKMEEMGSMPGLKYVPVPEAEGKLQLDAQVNKEHWERLGTLSIEVKVKNISDQMLLRVLVTHTLFDKSDNVMGTRNAYGVGSEITRLNPGEVGTADLSMLVVSNAEQISRVEYSLKDVLFAEGSAIVQEPVEEKPTEEPVSEEGSSYTILEYPQSPKEPKDVVLAFFGYINDGEYEKAVVLTTGAKNATKEEIKARTAELKMAMDEMWFQGKKLADITLGESIEVTTPEREIFRFKGIILQFTDGTTKEASAVADKLIKENGQWRIVISWSQ